MVIAGILLQHLTHGAIHDLGEADDFFRSDSSRADGGSDLVQEAACASGTGVGEELGVPAASRPGLPGSRSVDSQALETVPAPPHSRLQTR